MTVYPHARLADLYKFLAAHLPQTQFTGAQLWDLYLTYSPDRMSLSDRAYVAGVHPTELWLVRYLQGHPNASWDDVMDASADVRQETYGWLLKGNTRAQNTRIRIILDRMRSTGFMTIGARSGFRSAIWCPRSAPRSVPPATGPRLWPS